VLCPENWNELNVTLWLQVISNGLKLLVYQIIHLSRFDIDEAKI